MALRPIVFWGLDPLSRSVAATLAHTRGAHAGGARSVVFEPKADAGRELRDVIVGIREAARPLSGSPEPRVALLTTTFGVDAAGRLDRLREVSEILEVIQPGLRSLVLVVLVPPLVAEEQERIETFECFLRLEQLAETVPFLDMVFVNRLPTVFYRHQAQAPDEELLELIACELCDEDLDDTIQGTARQLVALGARVSGRKCPYATVGSYRLHYPAAEAMRHLEARLGRELFVSGFMNIAAIDEEQRSAIQGRADAFVSRQVGSFDTQLGDSPFVLAGQALIPLSGDPPMEERVYRFHEEVNAALKTQSSAIAEAMKRLPEAVRSEVADFLAESPLYLAGAKLYTDALNGSSLIQPRVDGAIGPSGSDVFDAVFCRERLVHSLANLVREQISLFTRSGTAISPQADDEAAADWLIRLLRVPSPVSSEPPGLASPARFMAAVSGALADQLLQSPSDPESARALEELLVNAFASEAAALRDLVESRRAEMQKLEDELRTRFGWLARNITRRTEREALRQQIAAISVEQAALSASHTSMHALLVAIVNRAVLPHIIRARLSRAFREAGRLAARDLETFVAVTAGALENKFQRATIPELDTTTAASVLTPAKIDGLFQMVVQRRRMADLAGDVLVFFPRNLSGADRNKLSYGACRHLGDHFVAGPESLIARMEAFSSDLCDSVRSLGILDLIELGDLEDDPRDQATEYLRDQVDHSRRFLEFSAGMLPLVENQQVMQTIFIVRTADGDRSALARRYDHLFRPQRRYVDSGDRLTIHIACLIAAFPAFLIHALDEGRRLFQAKNGTADSGTGLADLWPEPTRARQA